MPTNTILKGEHTMLTQSSIGIIGGADGPTKIFITGKFPTVGVIAVIGAAVAIGFLVYYLKHRK